MKVAIKKSILENMLLNVQPYLEKKDLTQITSHVLILVQNNTLTLKATDYEIGLSYNTTEATISTEGSTTANGRKLLDIVKGLKDDDVILETINDSLHIKQKNSKFKLPVLNFIDFPAFPTIENKPKFNIESHALVRSIKKIASSIDTNNPKFELNGALIDIKDNLINFVSTDTKRLAIMKVSQETTSNFSLIIPKKAIFEMQKLFFDTIEIFYDENTLIASSSNFTFFTKLINGKFPDYQRIVPKNINFSIPLNRELMIDAIKQISIISNEIKITFKPYNILFESLNDDNIEAKTEIESPTGLQDEILLAVNSKYILEFLSSIETSDFTLGLNNSSLPFKLESGDFMTIVMPIMI